MIPGLSAGQAKAFALAGIVAAGLAVGVLEREALAAGFDAFVRALADAGPAGWVAVALVQFAVALLGVVPGSVLGAVTGALYGPVLGFAISAVALLTAASAAFLLSRTLLRPFAERLRERHAGMADVTALLEAEGWRLVCLIRLSPVLPFAPTSYLLGLSRLSFRDYIVGTLASLPALFCYVLIGSVSAAGVENGSTAEMLKSGMIVVGLGASAVLTAHVVRRVARARQPALAPAE